MSATINGSTSPISSLASQEGYALTACRFNGQPVYYHAGLDDLAVEDLQEARLVAVPHDAERIIRDQLDLPRHIEAKGSFVGLVVDQDGAPPRRGRVLYSNSVGLALRVTTVGETTLSPTQDEFWPWDLVIVLTAETPTARESELLSVRRA